MSTAENKFTLLARGALEDVLLIGAGGDEAVHFHLLVLPDAVAARHRLQVVLQRGQHTQLQSDKLH